MDTWLHRCGSWWGGIHILTWGLGNVRMEDSFNNFCLISHLCKVTEYRIVCGTRVMYNYTILSWGLDLIRLLFLYQSLIHENNTENCLFKGKNGVLNVKQRWRISQILKRGCWEIPPLIQYQWLFWQGRKFTWWKWLLFSQ